MATQDYNPIHFNPRSREGSDNKDQDGHDGELISIHAPAKGATKLQIMRGRVFKISIHAPAKGATYTSIYL